LEAYFYHADNINGTMCMNGIDMNEYLLTISCVEHHVNYDNDVILTDLIVPRNFTNRATEFGKICRGKTGALSISVVNCNQQLECVKL